MKELQIIVPEPNLPEIPFDLAKYEKMLDGILESYKNLVVTEDTIKDCKKSATKLNKLKKSVNDQKITFKKKWDAPYIELENKLKSLMSKIDDGASEIKKGLDFYEQKRIEEKTRICNELLAEKVEELPEYMRNKLHLVDNYTNVSMTIKSISDHLDTQIINLKSEIERTEKEIQTAKDHIKTMNETFGLKTPLTEKDFERQFNPENLNLSWLMEDITKRAKSRHEAENKVVEEIKQPEIVTPKVVKSDNELVLSYNLEIECTKSQFEALKEYLVSASIVYQEEINF